MQDHFLNFYDKKIILASESPRRRNILKMIGLDFTVTPSNYDETGEDHRPPTEMATYHARKKAQDVAQDFSDPWIIGADTIVVLGNDVLEKPRDKKEAIHMLQQLSGKTHLVITGYTILNSNNGKYISTAETTEVTFQDLNDKIIKYYINNYEYRDKAGSYAIQDFSALFVKDIKGCFYNVVGFPVSAFCNKVQNNLSACL